jgi:8-oxo-dGTP pyrophosphatase MutT (NUDIX family)
MASYNSGAMRGVELRLRHLNRRTLRAPTGAAALRRAAVLCPLVTVHGQPAILFTLRTSHVGTHKGQVSFPGGHVHAGESAERAALRETVEELGDAMGGVRALGLWHDVPAVTGTIVTPVVGVLEGVDLGDLASLRPCAAEVEAAFALTLARLRDPAYVAYEHRHPSGRSADAVDRGIRLPIYSGGPAPVWGLTAYLLQGILADAIAPALAAEDKGGVAAAPTSDRHGGGAT